MSHLGTPLAKALLGASLLTGAMTWLAGGCGPKIEPGTQASGVQSKLPSDARIATVQQVGEPASEEASGTLASSRQTSVSARILARIESVEVTAGSVVRAGDVLVHLDDRRLRAAVDEAGQQRRAAQARLDLASVEARRVEKLEAAEVASQGALDQAHSALRVARADLRAQDQRVRDARVALSYAIIQAPVNGRVVDRLAEPGDMAAPGVPLLRIYDPSVLRLEAPVRESLAVKLRIGQALGVRIDAVDERFTGHIDEIVPFADPGARTLLVKVGLPEDPRLFAGMFGRLDVPAGNTKHLLVPASAITGIGQLSFTTALDAKGRPERRWVTLGPPRQDGRRVILSGLAAGERVLLPPPD